MIAETNIAMDFFIYSIYLLIIVYVMLFVTKITIKLLEMGSGFFRSVVQIFTPGYDDDVVIAKKETTSCDKGIWLNEQMRETYTHKYIQQHCCFSYFYNNVKALECLSNKVLNFLQSARCVDYDKSKEFYNELLVDIRELLDVRHCPEIILQFVVRGETVKNKYTKGLLQHEPLSDKYYIVLSKLDSAEIMYLPSEIFETFVHELLHWLDICYFQNVFQKEFSCVIEDKNHVGYFKQRTEILRRVLVGELKMLKT